MTIQWYPGHMAKARRIMESRIRQVDALIELVDARLPISSRNPVLEQLSTRRPSIIVMTRSDLADPDATEAWRTYFETHGRTAVAANVLSGEGLGLVRDALFKVASEKINRDKQRGIKRTIIRAMVVGIPNVGKSSFINKSARRSIAKTGNQPGVTRQEQWVKMGDIELLDTPGVLWPKIDTPEQGLRLALSGAIKEQIYDVEEVAAYFLTFASTRYPQLLADRYKLTDITPIEWSDMQTVWPQVEPLFTTIGKLRGMLVKGGEVDLERVSRMVIKEVQDGILGRITLEWPERQLNVET
ncbi:ribosome biogenesis GTPase YlqF [Alicyclobacillus dauci]|uniref:Ribosome biogenesis GTPase A n=1 Tax=Alicyclobacillus dauci TaxID=1475485 RepID=A0ABY6YXU2_9BACL|nr:ribosome biogenesis GTPase YlqF [Alicyclobacillus dauci]WAH35442.1 ribosome biogenesis GTPase YlqF [Alicyclobacillus dauci]